MEQILVSACLLGERCKYSGGSNYSKELCDFIEVEKERFMVVPVCPEVMGGLLTPRTPAEIRGSLVVTNDGKDVTDEYERGARKTAKLAKEMNCRFAVLKERSPSCGSGLVYDGTFTHTVTQGDGKTAGLLKRMGIEVFGESQIERLKMRLMD